MKEVRIWSNGEISPKNNITFQEEMKPLVRTMPDELWAHVREKALSLGAVEVCPRPMWSWDIVVFPDVSVIFSLSPMFFCKCDVHDKGTDPTTGMNRGHFSNKAEAEALKESIDTAVKFMEFLGDFYERHFSDKCAESGV